MFFLVAEDEELVIGNKTIISTIMYLLQVLWISPLLWVMKYHYNMSGEFDAKINKSIADIDWQSMVSSAFADFDVEAAAENPESLVELGGFMMAAS